MDKPCYETRIAIVSKKARLRGITLPEEVITYIARRVESNTRELEGAITKIQGHAMLNGGRYDMEVARAALGDIIPPSERMVTIQQIIDAVTRVYNIRVSDLHSKRRHKSIALPRQICMYLARQQDAVFAGGNRRLLRRARPHHGHARHQVDQGRPRARPGVRQPAGTNREQPGGGARPVGVITGGEAHDLIMIRAGRASR